MPKGFITSFGIFHRLVKAVGGDYILSFRSSPREDGSYKTTEIDYTVEDLGKLKDILVGEFLKDDTGESKLAQEAIAAGYWLHKDIKIIDTTDGTEYFTTNDPVRLFSPRVINGMKANHKYVYLRCYKKEKGMPGLWLEFDPLQWLDANLTPAELKAALKKLELI